MGKDNNVNSAQPGQAAEPAKKEKKTRKVKKVRRPSRIVLILVSLLLVIVLALNVVVIGVVSPYFGFINNFLSSDPDTEEALAATAASAEITQEIEEEGIILLTNNNDALPLTNLKVNLFGAGTKNFTYGGTGSGAGDTSGNVTLQEGLEYAGIEYNTELNDFIMDNVEATEEVAIGYIGSDYNLTELDVSVYSDELIANAVEFSDTAVVVFSRVGGEGYDLPYDMDGYAGGDAGKSYLELQDVELALMDLVTENFDKVIVILNSPNAMELGFLEDYDVDAALWVGCPGSTGCNAIGEVLAGLVNPSGRTTDTFPYEVESAPSYYSFGDYDYSNTTYTNDSLFGGTGTATTDLDCYHYVDYIEGIYVGYRYYETAAADGFIDFEETVQFPFGYGLSYTEFEETLVSYDDDGTTITLTISVENTGDVAGKDVVEVYYTAPYYTGGIEKSEVVLIGYEKTESLEPGASQTLTISFDYEDMASYDYEGIKAEGGAYVLEEGTYTISLRTDSHTVVDSFEVEVAADVIYNEENDGARSSDDVAATNQFDDVSYGDGITYVSRADWEGTFPTERLPESKEATEEQIAAFEGEPLDNSETEDIVFADHGLSLSDMKGLDYDDPLWDDLLEQLSVSDMTLLIGNGGWATYAISSIDKPYLSDCDGPNGVNNIMAGITGNQFTGQSVLGYTWNKELAQRFGEIFAEEAIAYGISGLYAPGLNIHRSPFSGRNYEYFSEDGFLAGTLAAAEISGIQSKGVYCYTKHFAVNDQETNRDAGGLVTWVNEQAMREIYLRGFEIAVKEGGTLGIMSSFNRIGATPAAESYALLTTVLRDEWGFQGCVITDCVMACDTQDVNRALRAGNDLQLTILGQFLMTEETTDTAAGRQALRRASKNILYMIANSDALENASSGVYGWVVALAVIDILILALFVLYYVRRHQKMRRWRLSRIVIPENPVAYTDMRTQE